MNLQAFDEPERKSLKIMHTRAVNFEIRPKTLPVKQLHMLQVKVDNIFRAASYRQVTTREMTLNTLHECYHHTAV